MLKAIEVFLSNLGVHLLSREKSKEILDVHGDQWVEETVSQLSTGPLKITFDRPPGGPRLNLPDLDSDIVFDFGLVLPRGTLIAHVRCGTETHVESRSINSQVCKTDIQRLVISSLGNVLNVSSPQSSLYRQGV